MIKKITPQNLKEKKKRKEKITALTAYDYLSARILDECGIDVILVGDSLGMVLLGYENTLPVTMADMIHHTRAVRKGVSRALLIGDMPYRSYDSPAKALKNAKRFLGAGAEAVKLEGGRAIQSQIRALIRQGIPVLGHLGMLPQKAAEKGKFHVYGKTKEEADLLLKEARLLDKLGVIGIVLECVPRQLAKKITRKISCPAIGIGAGEYTDGQILVLHDMLGFEGKVRPRFVRKYARFEGLMKQSVAAYRRDVLKKKFPSAKESY